MSLSYLSNLSLAALLTVSSVSIATINANAQNTSQSGSTDKNQQIICWPKIYDSSARSFVIRKGGISERFLNNVDNSRYKKDDYLEYFRRVDSLENVGIWGLLPDSLIEQSCNELVDTAIRNFQLISNVESISRTDLKNEVVSLKYLLSSLDSISVDKLDLSEKLRKMYNCLNTKISVDKDANDDVDINSLVSGQLGKCNAVAPAFYSILTYYGFDAVMCFGKQINNSGKKVIYHAWIGVNLDDGYIDLDPTYYPFFVPLENRCKDIKRYTVKDEYIGVKRKITVR